MDTSQVHCASNYVNEFDEDIRVTIFAHKYMNKKVSLIEGTWELLFHSKIANCNPFPLLATLSYLRHLPHRDGILQKYSVTSQMTDLRKEHKKKKKNK